MTNDKLIDKIECLKSELMVIRSRATTTIIIHEAIERDCDTIYRELEKIAKNLEVGLDATPARR